MKLKRPPYAKVKPEIKRKRIAAYRLFKKGKYRTLTEAAESCDCNYDQFRNWLKLNNLK